MYPNYRNTVEIIIIYNRKILIMKRSENAKIAPGVWHVPAGKVKYEEIPKHAVIREALEETNLHVEIVKEASVRTFQSKDKLGEPYYRCIFTYLVKPLHSIDSLQLNEEHSASAWVDVEQLCSPPYDSFDLYIKSIILENL